MEPIIGAAPGGDGADVIKDGDTESFEADVIAASRKTPVIVDFWAPWCGPCKQLGPALEKAARAAGGKVRLVKINIDENPQLAEMFRVQSIPAVFAFDKGQPVDGFAGALPESQIKAFVQRLTGDSGPTAVEQALARAGDALESGDYGTASALFSQILGHEADNPNAIAGLARCYLAAGEPARAREILDTAAEKDANHPEIAGARAALVLAEEAAQAGGDLAGLEDRLARDSNDHPARYDLALALYGAGQREAAVEHLLEIVRRNRGWNDEAARKKLVDLFEAFGPDDPLTVESRRKLSSLLFA
ncbi:MAG: thioredoxin [Alphaproteobacteria bacterium]